MGLVFLGHAGTKPIGLITIAPLCVVLDADLVFLAGGVAVLLWELGAAASVHAATYRACCPRRAEPAVLGRRPPQ